MKVCIFYFVFLTLGLSNIFGFDASRIRPVTPEDGLSHAGFKSIVQDNKGYIWCNTIDEVYKFDAYKFNRINDFYHQNKIVTSLKYFGFFKGTKGKIWLTTNKGLFLYNESSGAFDLVLVDENIILSLVQLEDDNLIGMNGNSVFYIDLKTGIKKDLKFNLSKSRVKVITPSYISAYEDDIYVATVEGVLFKMSRKSKMLEPYIDVNHSITQVEVASVFITILTPENGVFQFEKNSKQVINFFDDFIFSHNKGNNIAKTFLCDDEILWVGTHRGLYRINVLNREISLFQKEKDDFSLPNNSIWTLMKDVQGGVWIGTYSGGLAYVSKNDHEFSIIKNGSSPVSCFAEDSNNKIWFGTEGGGLYSYNPVTQQTVSFKHSVFKNSLNYDNVKSLVADNKNLWIGMFKNGLDCFVDEKTFIHYHFESTNPNGYTIYSMLLETNSGLWIAPQENRLDFFDFKQKKITNSYKIPNVRNALDEYRYTSSITRGSKNNLWLGTQNGLFLFDTSLKTFKRYCFNLDDTTTYGSNEIMCVHNDNKGRIWVGTRNQGLYSFDVKKAKFSNHLAESKTRVIYHIMEDSEGQLWCSSNNGIYKYDPKKNDYRHFDYRDGLQGNLFYANSGLKTLDGNFYFGGTNGITYFNPNNITDNNFIPPVYVSSLYVNNGKRKSIVDKSGNLILIDNADLITFNHKEQTIEFEFSALNYLIPEKNLYAYKLDGYDENWTYCKHPIRRAVYTNLKPGDYVFRLKASNNDGVWNENERQIKIVILPPPWKTWWAYLIYNIFFFSFFSFLIFTIIKRRKYQLEAQKEKIEKEKVEELTKLKMGFFSNITHEFKTPLSLIAGPINILLNSYKDDPVITKQLNVTYKNVLRLQNLIVQLLDFRHIENKTLPISRTSGDIIDFLKRIYLLFENVIVQNNISVQLNSDTEQIIANFDHDKYEKIFTNILSNALKFTIKGGVISINISHKITRYYVDEIMGEILIVVENTVEKDQSLDSLYKVGMHDNIENILNQPNSGIGLTFTKDIVDLLGGKIDFTCENGEAKVAILLPLYKSDVNAQKGNEKNIFQFAENTIMTLDVIRPSSNQGEKISKKTNIVLIVEDSQELRSFLNDLLIDTYKIITAENGNDGIKKAKSYSPQIIISDVQMPDLDGIEMSRLLKNDIETSHIPIILLSAYTSQDYKNKGLTVGADVYMEKPFDVEYLKLQVKTLIQSRENIKKKFSKRITADIDEIESLPLDEVFVKQAINIVQENMSNYDFSVDIFVNKMAVGRTVLYKKIKTLTGMSINDFINDIRLKKAIQLLKKGDLTIAEVSYQVGFNSPKYFGASFKKHFGITPKDFIFQSTTKKDDNIYYQI